jgi:hypothetical protein
VIRSHAPEVLLDLAAKLRRELGRREPPSTPSSSFNVYEIPRDEIAAAVAYHVLEVDREATRAWEFSIA